MRFDVFRLCALAVLVSLPFAEAAFAQVAITVEQTKVVRSVDASGNPVESLVPVETVVPGETVVYRYIIRNTGVEPADDIVVSTAVPEAMTYQAFSADEPVAQADLSADGGVSFGSEETLEVLDIDDTYRPAGPADITHLKWELTDSVPPGGEASVGFRAVLNQ